MKIIQYSLILILGLLMVACGGDDKKVEETAAPEEKKVNVIRSTTYVNPSPDSDYPSVYKKLGIGMMSKTEVINQGADTEELEKNFMLQLITEKSTQEVIDFYKSDLASKGWKEGNINVYSGAQKAILMENDKAIFKAIIIDEEDHRKVAIILNKPIDMSKYEE